ncbi:ETC complex I subunit [Methylobacterium sp. E-005]|uniref:NADH dehydrogenase ubiquinone Fe-S protein 4 n=1 Tax=Methylobacterium sp. E-005 TaxID=2836549 RepID=UPI001FBBDA4B|nr:NADH dehydrogenase ubiquinone Fe-S protein 4 [Methylobacterium sp. E-005]MCJ2087347.1 ETC complex I subunit [Methylobacterium sp. E-005]
MEERTIGLGHNNPPVAVPPGWLAGRTARIRRRGRPVDTAGRARTGTWLLTFERETPPEIEPLMGWTAGDDPLATQVQLSFPTRAQAIAYAERQGLAYTVEPETGVTGPTPVTPTIPSWRPGPRPRPPRPPVRRASGGRRTAPALPDLERALINPAAVFATPRHVLDHPRLLPGCKREILRRWAWDEHLKEVAAAEGMAEGEPSQLDAVKAALLALGETWHPHPAAPAAALPVSGDLESWEPDRMAA